MNAAARKMENIIKYSYLKSILVLALATGLAACGAQEAPIEGQRPVEVATMAIERADGYEQASSYTGRVEAGLDSALGFEVGGLLAEVPADEGDVVEQGQVLARLDTARLQAQRMEAQASLDSVRAELDLANATLSRTQDAIAYKGVSRQQLDEAQQRVNSLQAQSRVAEARLNRIQVDINKAVLRAPFVAVVVARQADPGEVLAPGEPMFQIQSTAAPEIRVGMAPNSIANLEVDRTYALDVNDAVIEARLRAVIPRRDETTRTVDAVFVVGDARSDVRPGDLAQLETRNWIAQPGYWIPLAALTEGPRGLWQVLVAQPEDGATDAHRLENRAVEVLYAETERAYVRGTLAAGDLLVTGGTNRVVAGQRVVPARASTSRIAAKEDGAQHAR